MEPDRQPTRGEPEEALGSALDLIGDRWSLLVVSALLEGAHRFADLQQAIPAIAPNVLSQRLRRLEAGGVVLAEPYSHRPTRYRYRLTATGAELAGAVRLLTRWGAVHSDPRAGASSGPTHSDCGTPLEVRWWCPTCDQPVDGDGAGPPEFV